jgi:hypothetical protein
MDHEGVIVTVLGAAGALAGLILVFLGIVVTTYQSYEGAVPAAIRNGFRQDAVLTLIPFTLGIACVCLSAVWLLLSKNNETLYIASIVVFFIQLATLLLAAGLVTRRVLWT